MAYSESRDLDIDKEIEKQKKLLEELEAKKKKEMAMSPAQRLAVWLHDSQCHYNHTDQCGWGYEITGGNHDWSRRTHADYLAKANTLLTFTNDIELIKNIIRNA